MNLVDIEVDKIIPYINNPRNNDDAVDNVAASIKEFGFKVPLVIDKDNVVVTGHTRLKAAKKLGLTSVPCIYADDLTEQQIKAFRLADNKVSEFSTWDLEKLDIELEGITDLEMVDFGFFDDIENLDSDAEIIEDEAPELPAEPTAKVGDIYRLGNHRLICGDSTDKTVIEKLMQGQEADLVFTDPPYNVAMSRSKVDGSDNSIINDDLNNDDYIKLLKGAFENVLSYCKTKTMYWWIGFRQYSTLENIFIENNIKISNCIVWDKGSIGLGGKGYRYQHELCIFSGQINNNSASDVWHFSRSNEGLHPTMKPIALITNAINNITNVEKVLDVFGGSGSTLIACEQLNKQCFMCELDPRYVDVIIKRWEEFTGNKAELIG